MIKGARIGKRIVIPKTEIARLLRGEETSAKWAGEGGP